MTLMTLIRQLRTSSMVTCGRPPTPISRMLPACTGNCRRQCCGINLSEQPSLGASSQPRLRKAILEREAGQIMHMAPSVSLVVAVATLAAAAPTATVQLLRVAATVCKLNAGSTGDTGAALVQQRCPGNCLTVAIAENGSGLHRTARHTRPSTHRLAAAVDAADARVALPCHIALEQRPRTRGREVCEKTLMGCARCVVGSWDRHRADVSRSY